MRLLIDEDSQKHSLVKLLREAGHDVLTAAETGLAGHPDSEVFALACREKRVLLTRNVEDFQALHNTEADHAGILAEYQNKDASKNMDKAGIVRSIGNIEASGCEIAGQFVALNAWNFGE